MTVQTATVDSDAILRIRYDPDAAELLVTFRSGEDYVYFDVPPAIFEAFRDAASHGRFFQARIRDHYRFERLMRPLRWPRRRPHKPAS